MARILIYDLEVSPILGWTYGLYDTRVIRVEQQPSIMSISWRWYGEADTHHESMASIARKRGTTVNEALTKLIWDLFNEADIVVAHNANKFDNKVSTAAFIKYGLLPPNPYKTVDTLRVARGVAKFTSNSLNDLGELFGLGAKTETTYATLWYDALKGNANAWEQMRVYNNQDVDLLYKLYEKLRPYIHNHPNLGDIAQVDGVCPKCGSDKLRTYGTAPRRNGRIQTYICGNCGGRCAESKIKGKSRIVNGV